MLLVLGQGGWWDGWRPPALGEDAEWERLAALLDWRPFEALLAPLRNARRGRPGYPPLALFRALLVREAEQPLDARTGARAAPVAGAAPLLRLRQRRPDARPFDLQPLSRRAGAARPGRAVLRRTGAPVGRAGPVPQAGRADRRDAVAGAVAPAALQRRAGRAASARRRRQLDPQRLRPQRAVRLQGATSTWTSARC